MHSPAGTLGGARVQVAQRLGQRGAVVFLVLTGLQSDDQGFAQVGVVLAEKLGIAHSTIIMEVQVAGTTLKVKRELEGGWFQWISMPLPAAITIQSGINQLRYATLKGIMAAKKKEIRKAAPPADLTATQEILSLAVPTKSKQTQMITGSPADVARDQMAASGLAEVTRFGR